MLKHRRTFPHGRSRRPAPFKPFPATSGACLLRSAQPLPPRIRPRVNLSLARPTKQKSATLRPTPLPVHPGRPDAQNDAVVDEGPNPAMTDAKPSDVHRGTGESPAQDTRGATPPNEGRTLARDSREGVEGSMGGYQRAVSEGGVIIV